MFLTTHVTVCVCHAELTGFSWSCLEQVILRLFKTARRVLSFVLRVSYGLNVWRDSRRSILRVIESWYITVTAWISSIECVRCNLCSLIVSFFLSLLSCFTMNKAIYLLTYQGMKRLGGRNVQGANWQRNVTCINLQKFSGPRTVPLSSSSQKWSMMCQASH